MINLFSFNTLAQYTVLITVVLCDEPDSDATVIIIGAGITGARAALELKRRGKNSS